MSRRVHCGKEINDGRRSRRRTAAQGNYDEFRFFTGLRLSEQIALVVADFDAARGTLSVTKARVNGHDKDATKTGEGRRIELCRRALAVLKRQLALRAELERAGQIDHDHLFFKANGKPIRNLQYPYRRWQQTLARMHTVRYRKPYCARQTSVSWDLMIGRSALWVARQHGHSISTMLRFYAAGPRARSKRMSPPSTRPWRTHGVGSGHRVPASAGPGQHAP